MTATILDGRKIADEILLQIKQQIEVIIQSGKLIPGLAIILVGNDNASKIYVENKMKACDQTGIHSKILQLPARITEKELLLIIDDLNNDESIHGIIVQLPLPKHINADNIIAHISLTKDVDGFHPYNLGRLAQGLSCVHSCTAKGIMHLMQAYNISLIGKQAVIVGASNIVGKPVAFELLSANATVTICHRYTQNLSKIVSTADILIIAVGKANFIMADWLNSHAVVIDVGINKLGDKIVGDVNFFSAVKKVKYITPVPGGVGPMTVAMLLQNTLITYAKIQQNSLK